MQISFFEHEVLHFPDILPKNYFLTVIIYKQKILDDNRHAWTV